MNYNYKKLTNAAFWNEFFSTNTPNSAMIKEAKSRCNDWSGCAVGTLVLPNYVPQKRETECSNALRRVVKNSVNEKLFELGQEKFPREIFMGDYEEAKKVFNEIQKGKVLLRNHF